MKIARKEDFDSARAEGVRHNVVFFSPMLGVILFFFRAAVTNGHSRDLPSRSSGGQEPEIKMSTGPHSLPLKALAEDPSLPLAASGGSLLSGCITPISAPVFT